MIDFEAHEEPRALNSVDGPYAYSILGGAVTNREGSTGFDDILAIRDGFMGANPGVVECLEVVAQAAIEASDGDQGFPSLRLPAIATDFGRLPGTDFPPSWAIELALDKIVRVQSGGRRFARYAYPSYYESPQFVGTEGPTSHFWSIGIEDAENPADYFEGFRPPHIIAVAITCNAATAVSRISDEQLAAMASQDRRSELHRVVVVEMDRLLEAELGAAFETARAFLTNPSITEEAAQLAQNRLGRWAAYDVTHPANKRYSPGMHSGVTYSNLLYIAQLALADRRV